MLYNTLLFLSFLQSVIGFTVMTSSVMLFKNPIKRRIVTGLAAMILGISILSFTLFTRGIDAVDRFPILVILLIEVSWFLICSGDRFFVSLFSFLTFVNIYVSISYTSDAIALNFESGDFVGTHMLLRLLIYLVIIPLLFKYVRTPFRMLVDTLDKEWRAATLVPLLFLLMQSLILYYPEPYWYWANDTWSRIIMVTVYLLFLAVYFLLYIQSNAIAEKYALEKRHLLMAQQEKLWESELIRQKAETTLANQQRHDMHHHNDAIMGLLQSGDLDTLKDYLVRYDEALEARRIAVFCLHPIANSLLNHYASQAEKENIKMTFHVSVPERIGIDHIDLTCVLGNALENALEGCQQQPADEEREIMITAKYFDKRLRLKIENTCRTDIAFDGELPVSHKQGGGTGTKSILYTAERYDGTAGFSTVNGRFTTQVVLNGKS